MTHGTLLVRFPAHSDDYFKSPYHPHYDSFPHGPADRVLQLDLLRAAVELRQDSGAGLGVVGRSYSKGRIQHTHTRIELVTMYRT